MFDSILFFLCISLSVSYMWSFSTIMKPIRMYIATIPFISTPLLCPECCSFWVGLITSELYNPILPVIHIILLSNIICGLITYFFASILYKKLFLQ